MKAVISVSSTTDSEVKPLFVVVDITADFVHRIEQMMLACTNGIVRVVMDSADGVWQCDQDEMELYLFGDELVVDRLGAVWMLTYSKTLDRVFETTIVELTTIRNDFEAGEELVFYGHNENDMRELYEEIFGSQLCSA